MYKMHVRYGKSKHQGEAVVFLLKCDSLFEHFFLREKENEVEI